MEDATKRDEIARLVSERRKALGGRYLLDPRVRALPRSGSRWLTPPGTAGRGRAATLPLLILTVLGAVALVACVATATAVVVSGVWLQGALQDPTTTVQGFYGALQQRDYAHAYTYFTTSARARLTEGQFESTYGAFDQIDGTVTAYAISHIQTGAGGNTASVLVGVSRQDKPDAVQVQTLLLVRENGNWRIESITLNGSAPVRPGG
ncbi:MAG TPA: hypothetical protein VIC85_15335 [Ktedonobacterales bacterium]|jgi:hypothetical protein